MVAPFLYPPGGVGDTSLPYWLSSVVGILILIFAALYWVVWRMLLPAVGRFRWRPEHSRLHDGTAVVTYQKEKRI